MDGGCCYYGDQIYLCLNQQIVFPEMLCVGVNATYSLLWLTSGCNTVVAPVNYGGVRSDVIQRPVCINHV